MKKKAATQNEDYKEIKVVAEKMSTLEAEVVYWFCLFVCSVFLLAFYCLFGLLLSFRLLFVMFYTSQLVLFWILFLL